MNTPMEASSAAQTARTPITDTIGKLESHLAKIKAMTGDLSTRLLGPMPATAQELENPQNHIHGRLQDLCFEAQRSADWLEEIVQQL